MGSALFSFGGALRLTCLWPLAFVYRIGLAFSRLLSPVGARLAVPVISVGSLTAGGSGKTPFVASLLRHLCARGIKAGVVGSGYGRSQPRNVLDVGAKAHEYGTAVVGDEIAELAEEFADVWFSVAATKRAAALALANSGAVEIILIDDGFQSPGLYRDLDIVLLNCESGRADFHLLPAGRAREPKKALSRADVVVFTKLADSASAPDWLEKMAQKHGKPGPAKRTFNCRNHFAFQQVNPLENSDPTKCAPSGRALVVSALADNRSFQRAATESGAQIGGVIEFDDHFLYDASCAAELRRECLLRSCSYILTSAKDWTKLKEFEWGFPVWVMSVSSEIDKADDLIDLITATRSR